MQFLGKHFKGEENTKIIRKMETNIWEKNLMVRGLGSCHTQKREKSPSSLFCCQVFTRTPVLWPLEQEAVRRFVSLHQEEDRN